MQRTVSAERHFRRFGLASDSRPNREGIALRRNPRGRAGCTNACVPDGATAEVRIASARHESHVAIELSWVNTSVCQSFDLELAVNMAGSNADLCGRDGRDGTSRKRSEPS